MTDHAPGDLVVALGEAQERSKAWRMNTSGLQNESQCATIKKHIKTFFEIIMVQLIRLLYGILLNPI